MELSNAIKRIEELESEIKELLEKGVKPEDKRYVERLKADMRKAANKREQSEKRAVELEELLTREKLRQRVAIAAVKEGCIDPRTFVEAVEARGLPEADAPQDDFMRWFDDARSDYPYFFNDERPAAENGGGKRPLAPMVAARVSEKNLSTQEQAAYAYRTE